MSPTLGALVIVGPTERGGQRPMTTLNAPEAPVLEGQDALPDFTTEAYNCLLYTSDAADE